MNESKLRIICLTALVETSPQALPLGAACIASSLKHDDYIKQHCDVILKAFSMEDAGITDDNASSIADEVMALGGEGPVVLCFSVYVWNRSLLEKVSYFAKKVRPDAVCIAGGPEVTACPWNFKNFDYTVCGEGEKAVPELVKAISGGQKGSDEKCGFAFGIQGVYALPVKQEAPVLVRALPPDTEKLESPYLDGTIDLDLYEGALWELARGCPFKCSYCYESKGEKKIQYFDMKRIEAELELFAKKKVPQIFVLDPTYNANKKRALDMLRLIKKTAPKTFFYFEARAEYIDRELARAFTSIPCCLQIGLQSAHEDVLAKVHRGLNRKLFSRNIAFLNEEGAVFGFDLIYGLPGDSLEGFKSSIDFALGLYPNNLEMFCLSVLPGTVLFEEAEGLKIKWQKNPPYNVIENETFGKKDMEKARELASAAHIFYTEGRAVPWFLSILKPLQMKPSVFFERFESFAVKKLGLEKMPPQSVMDSEKIEMLQKEFVRECYAEKKLARLIPLAEDLIALNGALGRCTADGTESVVSLHYHPDDLMSGYAGDLNFFVRNAGTKKCRAKIFVGKFGADWRVL